MTHSFIRDVGHQSAQGAGGLVQFLPFAIILGIFYFMILLPMKRRQKKVQEFQEALKVGDKIVTTSGIYGQITRLNDKSVQVQIADKVRIEVARAAVGGYQGQEPVVTESGNTEPCTRIFAGKSSPFSSCLRRLLRHRRLPAARTAISSAAGPPPG